MISTPNDLNEYENYEETILKEDLEKLNQIDQYAIKVIDLEKDTTRQIELLKLWTHRDLHFSISSTFAWKIICKASGQKLGIPEPVSGILKLILQKIQWYGVRYLCMKAGILYQLYQKLVNLH